MLVEWCVQLHPTRRHEARGRFEQIILLDLDLCNHQNVEQNLWRSTYYQVIEMLRHETDDDTAKRHLLAIIEEVLVYSNAKQFCESLYCLLFASR